MNDVESLQARVAELETQLAFVKRKEQQQRRKLREAQEVRRTAMKMAVAVGAVNDIIPEFMAYVLEMDKITVEGDSV